MYLTELSSAKLSINLDRPSAVLAAVRIYLRNVSAESDISDFGNMSVITAWNSVFARSKLAFFTLACSSLIVGMVSSLSISPITCVIFSPGVYATGTLPTRGLKLLYVNGNSFSATTDVNSLRIEPDSTRDSIAPPIPNCNKPPTAKPSPTRRTFSTADKPSLLKISP